MVSEVICVRHAIAEEIVDWQGDDRSRPLTSRGISKWKEGAKGLHRVVGNVDKILTSPYLRAIQTAEILAKEIGKKVEIFDELGCGNGEHAVALLPVAQRIICFGHEPDLRVFAALACDIHVSAISPLKKGGALSIRQNAIGNWELNWILAARHLRLLGE
jgi:phosphohistidine phosphatase